MPAEGHRPKPPQTGPGEAHGADSVDTVRGQATPFAAEGVDGGRQRAAIRRQVRDVDRARGDSGENRELEARRALDDGGQHPHLIGGMRSPATEYQGRAPTPA